jgi:hypothetical protein
VRRRVELAESKLILAYLETNTLDYKVASDLINRHPTMTRRYLKALHDAKLIHIAEWRKVVLQPGPYWPVYALGADQASEERAPREAGDDEAREFVCPTTEGDFEVSYLTGRQWGHAPRYCEQHKEVAPVKGGEYRKDETGLKQVWICKACKEREKERGSMRTSNGA